MFGKHSGVLVPAVCLAHVGIITVNNKVLTHAYDPAQGVSSLTYDVSFCYIYSFIYSEK